MKIGNFTSDFKETQSRFNMESLAKRIEADKNAQMLKFNWKRKVDEKGKYA